MRKLVAAQFILGQLRESCKTVRPASQRITEMCGGARLTSSYSVKVLHRDVKTLKSRIGPSRGTIGGVV